MKTVSRILPICLGLMFLVFGTVACGGGGADSGEPAGEKPVADTAASADNSGAVQDAPSGGSMATPEAASVVEFFKDMAASEGIYFGEVPEGFPLDIIPVHPDGEIDKSSVNEEDFTLLQMVAGDKDSIFGWYKDHFAGLGFRAGDPFTMMERTMVGFDGSDGEVSMTLTDREDGKVFVSLVLSLY